MVEGDGVSSNFSKREAKDFFLVGKGVAEGDPYPPIVGPSKQHKVARLLRVPAAARRQGETLVGKHLLGRKRNISLISYLGKIAWRFKKIAGAKNSLVKLYLIFILQNNLVFI